MHQRDEDLRPGERQGEHLEGSLTDGGSLPGAAHRDEDRSFGAGRRAEPARDTTAADPKAGRRDAVGDVAD